MSRNHNILNKILIEWNDNPDTSQQGVINVTGKDLNWNFWYFMEKEFGIIEDKFCNEILNITKWFGYIDIKYKTIDPIIEVIRVVFGNIYGEFSDITFWAFLKFAEQWYRYSNEEGKDYPELFKHPTNSDFYYTVWERIDDNWGISANPEFEKPGAPDPWIILVAIFLWSEELGIIESKGSPATLNYVMGEFSIDEKKLNSLHSKCEDLVNKYDEITKK